jgi:hypothetical protein
MRHAPSPLGSRDRARAPLARRRRRPLGSGWRAALALASVAAVLATVGSARAVVVDPSASGSSVPFAPAASSAYDGVALMAGSGTLASAGVPVVSAGSACTDPWLSADLSSGTAGDLPAGALCYQGGDVLPANETVALAWDPLRRYWQGTRQYLEQFLRDVAGASSTLATPFALTAQYRDAQARAADRSKYGGACVDLGNPGGYTCTLGDQTGSGMGSNYPNGGGGDCPSVVPGASDPYMLTDGSLGTVPNSVCLTDADIRAEVQRIVFSTGFDRLHDPGYTPLIDVLLPAGVEVCLNQGQTLCSANTDSAASNPASPVQAQFCSYHSWTVVDGIRVPYAVQPWTSYTSCDEPKLPNPPAVPIATAVGMRLVGPLSQAQIAAIVNPWLDGWFADDGSEIDRCAYRGAPQDNVTIGSAAYTLPREGNNAGLIQNDPNSPACALGVLLQPQFAVPSAVEHGDAVAFDGSQTSSTLIVPSADYRWSFGDGTGALGPSVTHVYAEGGTYTVTLTVTDRGGNSATVRHTISVLGPKAAGSGSSPSPGLRVRAQLLPQSLRAMLRGGMRLRISSNERADAIVRLTIPRAAARRAHLAGPGRAPVTIGRGTIRGIRRGTIGLRLRLSRWVARHLAGARGLTVTVHLLALAAGGRHEMLDVAAGY